MQTNYNVTFKIVDKRQLNYSAHENIVLDFQDNDFVSAHNNNYPLHSLFDGVSKLDTTDNFTTHCYFPIFMPKIGNIEKYGDIRKQEIYSLLEDYKHVLKSKNVIPIVIDSLETNPDIKTIITDFSHLCPNGLYGITADKAIADNKKLFYFSHWEGKMPCNDELISYTPNKDYINLTRVVRYHRAKLVEALHTHNLIDCGYNTWSNVYNSSQVYLDNNPASPIHNIQFDTLDIDDLTKVNPNDCYPHEACQNSFLSLVTETNLNSGQLFYSEKTFRPIAIGMPFMILGNPGSISDLKQQGYITFDDWWDESYDDDVALNIRIARIIKNLKWLNDRTDDFKIGLRKEMEPILEHNQTLYRILQKKNHAKDLFTRIKKQWIMSL